MVGRVINIYCQCNNIRLNNDRTFISDMCTGNFVESDVSDSGDGKQRPTAGTKCVKPCVVESGRWGSSWCYTEEDESQWGAECVLCSGDIKFICKNEKIQLYILRIAN